MNVTTKKPISPELKDLLDELSKCAAYLFKAKDLIDEVYRKGTAEGFENHEIRELIFVTCKKQQLSDSTIFRYLPSELKDQDQAGRRSHPNKPKDSVVKLTTESLQSKQSHGEEQDLRNSSANDNKKVIEQSLNGSQSLSTQPNEEHKPIPIQTQTKVPTDEEATEIIDLSRFVPKEDYDNLQNKYNDLEKQQQPKPINGNGDIWKGKCQQLSKQVTELEIKLKEKDLLNDVPIRDTTQIEFGTEMIDINVSYNLVTKKFSAAIPIEIQQKLKRRMR